MPTSGLVRNDYRHKELQTCDQQILRLSVGGMTVSAISKALGVPSRTIQRVLTSPLAKQRIGVLQDKADDAAVDIKAQIEKLQPLAMRMLNAAVDKESEEGLDLSDEQRLKASFKILEMGGNVAVQKHLHGIGIVTGDLIDQIVNSALGPERCSGDVVEAELVEVG